MEKFRQECLEAHNRCRKIHGVPPLVIDPQVNSEAHKWALHCAFAEEEEGDDGWKLNHGNAYAETLHLSRAFTSGTEIVDEFYQEEKQYRYDSKEYNPLTARFINMIWKESTKMGIGRAEAPSGNIYVVVNYSPGTKTQEKFKFNVFPPGSTPETTSTLSEVASNKLDNFIQECVDAHNHYRNLHGVQSLVLDAQVKSDAQRWAEYCARCDSIKVSNEEQTNGSYTNYSIQSYDVSPHSWSGRALVDEMYTEGENYRFDSTENCFQTGTGRFANLVWKASTKIGVGRAKAPSGNVYVVINYFPGEVGNTQFDAKEYKENVLPTVSQQKEAKLKEAQCATPNKTALVVEKKETVVVAKPVEKKETIKVDVNSKFDSFSRECLDAHNVYRKKHGSPPLVLSEWLMGVAQDWANNCASRGMMYHSNHPNDQENIYATSGRVSSGREAVDCFYKEIQYYRFGSMGFTMQTGHFTQVVWKSTTMMGVGKATGRNGWTYVIVSYSPRGNMQGHFSANVLPPRN
ncbi:hypothetical protein DAPPUDRAFT_442793 [Daphnia pulex]|uniref:SCP domain-containing protein n=1 Tax=Daphnia pulex TaxID=6669 RepID=E9G4J5_DAPPU|nr:hypothetical protein DAPPUDRAFT_442793 [Daphnia pulex]|eukprot:EFX85315.1 hypothetical protein DAPPUDRAFT_442793 [Daphnia pulex]